MSSLNEKTATSGDIFAGMPAPQDLPKPEAPKKEKKSKEAKTEPVSPIPTTPTPPATNAEILRGDPSVAPSPSAIPPAKRTLHTLASEFLMIVARLDAIGDMPTGKGLPDDARQKALDQIDAECLKLAQRLEATDAELENKVEGWARFIRQIESDADLADKEAKRLGARADAFEDQAKRLKTALCNVLDTIGKQKVQTPFATVWTQANQASMEVESAEFVPSKFIKAPPPPEQRVDMKGLLAWIDEGNPVPRGVKVNRDKRHLRIK